MSEPIADPIVPLVIEIKMGGLAYIDRQGTLFDYDFADSDFQVTKADQFVFAASRDCGAFIVNRNRDHNVFCGMALMPSFAPLRGSLPQTMSYRQVIEDLRDADGRDLFESTVKSAVTDPKRAEHAIANFRLAVQSPVWAPNLLADHIIKTMGTDIEVRIFGGTGETPRSTPEIMTALVEEFQSRGISSVIAEESITDLDTTHLIASVHPYTERGSDRVLSRSHVDQVDAIIGITVAAAS